MMKIVMVVRLVDGGMKKHIDILLRGLEGYPVEIVLVGSEDLVERFSLRSYQLEIPDGISYGKDMRSVRRLSEIFKRESPDLIHVHGFKAALVSRFALLLQRKPPPLIFTLHNYPIWSTRKGLHRFNIWLERRLQRRTDGYIAVSYPLATYVARTWKANNVHVIHNGIEINCREYSQPVSELTVGTMVRLVKEKGTDVLLAALALLKREGLSVKCLIAGNGPEHWELQRLSEEYGLEDKVSFLGRVDDVESFMKQLNIFVMPSRSEGLSYAILEAMTCGVPVIASDVGGIPDLVEPGVTGYLVQPDEPTALAQALQRILLDRTMLEFLGANGRRKVLTDFTAQEMVKQTVEVYQQVIDRGIVGK